MITNDDTQPKGLEMSEHAPDPTVRTLETVHREVLSLDSKISVAMDYRGRLFEEKFDSVKREFDLVERGRVEQKADTKQAVDAALIAQKEAVREQTLASEKSIAKSETATAKQIEQQSVSYDRGIAALTGALSDLKDRVIKIEAIKLGNTEQIILKNDEHSGRRIDMAVLLQAAAIATAIYLALHK